MDPLVMIEQLKEANKILFYQVQETEEKVEMLQEENKILKENLRETERKVVQLKEAKKCFQVWTEKSEWRPAIETRTSRRNHW